MHVYGVLYGMDSYGLGNQNEIRDASFEYTKVHIFWLLWYVIYTKVSFLKGFMIDNVRILYVEVMGAEILPFFGAFDLMTSCQLLLWVCLSDSCSVNPIIKAMM